MACPHGPVESNYANYATDRAHLDEESDGVGVATRHIRGHFLIGWVVRRFILKALRAWTTRTESRAGLVIAEALSGPILIWAAILALHVALQSSKLPRAFTEVGAETLFVLWIVSLTLMSMRIARNLIRFYGSQVAGALPVATLTQNLAQIGVVILGVLILLDHFKVSITPMLTALGVGGLAWHWRCKTRFPICLAAFMWPWRTGQAGGLHQAEHRRRGIRHRHRLAQHHHPEPGEQSDYRAQRQAGAGHCDQLRPAGEAHVGHGGSARELRLRSRPR